ncbi:MAG: hypothetical protein NT072_06780 [Deltaproteobacteria bacterium]|nr:hypothetical protein [Deltaproteobacteria bacterium]
MKRPTHKELDSKIKQALVAVRLGRVVLVEPEPIIIDAFELGYEMGDLQIILTEMLQTIRPDDYAGTLPPQKSYEDKIWGAELFAFRFFCSRFGCEVYVKFALKDEDLMLVSLHKHRMKQE